MNPGTSARAVHDLSLAAWFGGSLMGAVGLNEAASKTGEPDQRLAINARGWEAWQPVQWTAVPAHLASGVRLTRLNRGRLAAQRGVGAAAVVKLVLTGVAVLGTVAASRLGSQLSDPPAPVEGGVAPAEETPTDIAAIQRRLRAVQWVVPAATGSMLVVNAVMGEQQRPKNVLRGVLGRLSR